MTKARNILPRFIAYYRVSTDRQGQSGLGIEAQREAVTQRLAATGGYPPLQEFIETESGRRADRPELAKALAACRVYKATLIIAKLDRLARNQQFLMALVDSGANVIFGDLPDIPPGAMGRFMLQQMAAVAELEAGLVSERTKAALRAKVERDGQWDRKAKHHLVPGAGQKAATAAVKAKAMERAADLADTVRQMAEEGLSLHRMAARLNEEGIPTARGATWTATAVRRIQAQMAAAGV
jgi:DNA invertase Pin-like site-specific DNA recombinase